MSLKGKLIEFLTNDPKCLNEIYSQFPSEKHSTLRGRLNENINKCFKRIGKGVYLALDGTAKALIIEGDAWEVLKEFDDNSIDAIITDSPYSCLDHQLAIGTTRKKNNEWSFKTRDIDKELLYHFFRVLKPGGHFFSFLPADAAATLKYNNKFIADSQGAGFVFNKRIIWNKINMSLGYNGRNQYEQIIFLSKGKRHMPYDLSIPDVLSHKRIPSSKRLHEAQKPTELIEDLVKFCSKEGDVLLDAFAGSLVLVKAGMRLNRHTIAIEIDGKMIEKCIGGV